MRKTIAAALLAAAAAVTVAGCGKKSDPNVPTAEENAALANTAAMDTSPDSLVAGDNAVLGNGEDSDDDDEDVGNGA
jgi:predicted small lipoprotein YifL